MAVPNVLVFPVNGKDIQIEDGGYTRIHNSILDAMSKMHGVTLAQHLIVTYILRKTYGFQKKEDKISLTQFEEGTGLSRVCVSESIKGLLDKHVLYRSSAGQNFIYGFNKYIEQWDASVFSNQNSTGHHFHKKKVASEATDTSNHVITSKPQTTSNHQTTSTSNHVITRTSNHVITHKRKKESLKKERGETATPAARKPSQPSTTPPKKERDPLLDHPAVMAYRETCKLAANEVQRKAIASKVGDLATWQDVLTEWMESGWRPANVNGMLDRYSNNGGTPPSVNGDVPGPTDNGALPDRF